MEQKVFKVIKMIEMVGYERTERGFFILEERLKYMDMLSYLALCKGEPENLKLFMSIWQHILYIEA